MMMSSQMSSQVMTPREARVMGAKMRMVVYSQRYGVPLSHGVDGDFLAPQSDVRTASLAQSC